MAEKEDLTLAEMGGEGEDGFDPIEPKVAKRDDFGDSIDDRGDVEPTLEELADEEENSAEGGPIKTDDEKTDVSSGSESSTDSSPQGEEEEQNNSGFSFNFGNSNDVNITVNGNVGEEDEIESPENQQEVPQEENDGKDEKPTGYIPSENEEEVDRSTKETEPQIDPEKPARTSLHTASDRATTENIDDVTAQNKDDINKRSNDEYGVTPLMCAINKGNAAMADALLENGADINMTNNVGETALMYAAANGNMELIEKLVERGADTEMKAGKGSAYEGRDFRAVLRDNLESSGKTPEEIEKTMADVEKMIVEKQGKSGEQPQSLTGNENNTPEKEEKRPDFHDKANWDRVGVRNQEGGIDEGYRFNLSGMSKDEMNEFISNLQENGIKGDLRQATIDTDNVKKGDLSYRITDPASVSRLESAVFGEKQQVGAEKGKTEGQFENTDTQRIDVIKQDKDGKAKESPISPSVEQSGNNSKRDDEKTDKSDQHKAPEAEKEGKQPKKSLWGRFKDAMDRVDKIMEKIDNFFFPPEKQSKKMHDRVNKKLEGQFENTDTQRIDVIKQDKDGKAKESPISPSVEQSGNNSKRDDEKTDKSDQHKAPEAEKEGKQPKKSLWDRFKDAMDRVDKITEKIDNFFFPPEKQAKKMHDRVNKKLKEQAKNTKKENSFEQIEKKPIDYEDYIAATQATAGNLGVNKNQTPHGEDVSLPQAMAQMTAKMLKEGPTKDLPQPEEKPREAFTSGKNEKGDEWACMTSKDENGNLSMIYEVNGKKSISFKFDEQGRLKEFEDANGGKYERMHDENGRMTGEKYTDKDGKITSKSLEYDEQGRVSRITREEPGKKPESKKVEYSKDGKPQVSKQAKALDAPVIKRQDLLTKQMMNEFSSHLKQIGGNKGATNEIASLKKGAIR